MTTGDVDDDGEMEIVAISFESNSGYDDGVVHVFDATSYELEWQSGEELFGNFAWTGVHDVAVIDIDGDGASEIVVATDELYDGALYLIDGTTRQVEAQYLYDDGSPLYALTLADMDGDGRPEIIAGGGKEHTGSPGTFVYVIDGSTGAVLWQTVSLSDGWNDTYALDVVDLDGDGIKDIVASLDNLITIDGFTHTIKKSSETDYRGLTVADRDLDGKLEIWAGTATGDLVKVDPSSLSRQQTWPICDTAVNSVNVNPVGSKYKVQVACDDRVKVFDPDRDLVFWQSEPLPGGAGLNDNMVVLDEESMNKLFVGHNRGVSAYEVYGSMEGDVDQDGLLNSVDNCPITPNVDQVDSDGDSFGDVCDICIGGNDTIDTDADGFPDACDSDDDNDGINDGSDNCRVVVNADQADSDGDGSGDDCDLCIGDDATDDQDVDGYCADTDCDDDNRNKFPGHAETCDGLDNNCNSVIDEGLTFDADGDGHSSLSSCSGSVDDCDDNDANSFPGNQEACDNLDNNCDGLIDEDLTQQTLCGMGACAGNTGIETCTAGTWWGDNCDSMAGAADEVCDSADNDCDGLADDGLTCDIDNPIQLESTFGTYTSIQSAYDNIVLGEFDTVRIKASDPITENLVFDKDVSIRLEGGYDGFFAGIVSATILNGRLTISAGQVTVSNIIIR